MLKCKEMNIFCEEPQANRNPEISRILNRF